MDARIIEHLRRWEKLLVIGRIRRGDEKTVISRGTPDFQGEPCFLCERDINSICMRIISPSLYGYASDDPEVYYAHRACFRRLSGEEGNPYEIPYPVPESLKEKRNG